VNSIPEGLAVATTAVDSGAAQDRLQQMVNSSRAEAAV
jgi:anthranilate phosphoribosyltransferase